MRLMMRSALLALLCMMAAIPALGDAVVVQQASNYCYSTSSCVTTFPTATTAGNTIITMGFVFWGNTSGNGTSVYPVTNFTTVRNVATFTEVCCDGWVYYRGNYMGYRVNAPATTSITTYAVDIPPVFHVFSMEVSGLSATGTLATSSYSSTGTADPYPANSPVPVEPTGVVSQGPKFIVSVAWLSQSIGMTWNDGSTEIHDLYGMSVSTKRNPVNSGSSTYTASAYTNSLSEAWLFGESIIGVFVETAAAANANAMLMASD